MRGSIPAGAVTREWVLQEKGANRLMTQATAFSGCNAVEFSDTTRSRARGKVSIDAIAPAARLPCAVGDGNHGNRFLFHQIDKRMGPYCRNMYA